MIQIVVRHILFEFFGQAFGVSAILRDQMPSLQKCFSSFIAIRLVIWHGHDILCQVSLYFS